MTKIGLFFGWISSEAEISIKSAKNIIKHFDHKKYTLVLIYRHKDWLFYTIKDINKLNEKKILHIHDFKKTFDIALPITHGKYWEDWTLQSIFTIQNIKYCGCHVLSSALCMDKSLIKLFFEWHNIPQTKFINIDFQLMSNTEIENQIQKVKQTLSLPLYIKPSNSWSSVGITKITKYEQLNKAIQKAKKYDQKVLIEEWLVSPKEIEVGIIGNKKLIVSEPWELILSKDFYDYDDKYKNNQTLIRIPAKIEETQQKKIQNLAKKVYKLCDCSGFARVDFFISNKKIFLNEINTLPGFTDISMFPMLMNHCGLSYTQLINRIISLAY